MVKITFPFIIRSVIPLPIHQVLPGIFSRWQTRFAKSGSYAGALELNYRDFFQAV